jgi:hypothetical protein
MDLSTVSNLLPVQDVAKLAVGNSAGLAGVGAPTVTPMSGTKSLSAQAYVNRAMTGPKQLAEQARLAEKQRLQEKLTGVMGDFAHTKPGSLISSALAYLMSKRAIQPYMDAMRSEMFQQGMQNPNDHKPFSTLEHTFPDRRAIAAHKRNSAIYTDQMHRLREYLRMNNFVVGDNNTVAGYAAGPGDGARSRSIANFDRMTQYNPSRG